MGTISWSNIRHVHIKAWGRRVYCVDAVLNLCLLLRHHTHINFPERSAKNPECKTSNQTPWKSYGFTPCKDLGIQESLGFQNTDRGFQIPTTGFRIPFRSIWESGSCKTCDLPLSLGSKLTDLLLNEGWKLHDPPSPPTHTHTTVTQFLFCKMWSTTPHLHVFEQKSITRSLHLVLARVLCLSRVGYF